MLKYLVILLDDTSVSYCHYANNNTERHLIPLDTLKAGIVWGMKENLSIQYVYPDYELSKEYTEVLDMIDHADIKPYRIDDNVDINVMNGLKDYSEDKYLAEKNIVVRLSKADIFGNQDDIIDLLRIVHRLNIVITDIDTFADEDFDKYERFLDKVVSNIEKDILSGKNIQTNILTDRIELSRMNNCNAGDDSITLAPDGKFYICPAFYYADVMDNTEFAQSDICKKGYSVGALTDGLNIKNQQLYKLEYAPLCRHCDAYQCKRCIWFNRRITLEVNTPSHQQCVIAHLERNASMVLLNDLKEKNNKIKIEIPKIDYLDPFEVRDRWK